MNQMLSTFLLFSTVVLTNAYLSDDSHAERSRESVGIAVQKTRIVEVMKELNFEIPPYLKDVAFCRQFLEDFKQQTHIEYLQPFLQTDDYDDPRLKVYRDKCPKLKLNKHIAWSPRVYYEGLENEPENVQEAGACCISYGTRNFKLFRIDINNDPKDGEEYVFYDQASRTVKPETIAGKPFAGKISSPDGGSYLIVNFALCKKGGGADAGILYPGTDRIANYHGPIRYRDRHYIFDFGATKSKYAGLTLNGFVQKSGTKPHQFGVLCSYTAVPRN